MEPEKCSLCGAAVKKENLRGHYDRVHPKRSKSLETESKTVAYSRQSSIFRSHRRRNILVLTLIVIGVVGVSFAAASYDRGVHWHPQLSVTINGSPFPVPAQIGIDPSLWKDHSLDQYGIGMAPLHTHDTSGKIHEEVNTSHRDFTLHEFLAIWGQSVDSGHVMGHPVDPGHRAFITVDGTEVPITSDPVLKDGQKIQIVCGP